MPAHTVRAARPKDAEAIVGINIAAWRAAYRGILPDGYLDAIDPEERATRMRARLLRSDAGALVAQDPAGDVVGLLFHGPYRTAPGEPASPWWEIFSCYVSPDRWRTGAGRALLAAALEQRGAPVVALWVLAENPRARAAYEAAGFTLDGGERVEVFDGVPVVELRYRWADPRARLNC